ncbi:MAG: hypothetical protein C5B59_04760, partial [Bacteroidetes bacterium]
MHKKSAENEKYVQAKSLSGRQQTLSQVIAKDAVILSANIYSQSQTGALRDSLNQNLINFERQQQQLEKVIEGEPLPLAPSVFKIKLLLTSIKTSYEDIVAIGREFTQVDTTLLHFNRAMYLRLLLDNEQKYLVLMRNITNEYTIIVSEKTKESTTIEAGKFISLIIAVVCLIILVLEPAFRRGEKNYKELQGARNELLNEKKHLASILQSQTNYVIRINRKGHFTYANTSFLKTFGYTREELEQMLFIATIFPKDIPRCQQIADECWNNPGKIVQLLIRKPFKNSRQFLWTDWEFLALQDESGHVKEIQGIGLNVTEKLLAQQVKEEAIETLSYAMAYAKMGSWKLDFVNQEIMLSKEFRALLAIEEDSAEKMAVDDFLNEFVVPEDLLAVSDEFARAIQNKENPDYEASFSCRVITRKGWMKYLFVKGKVIDENGSFGIAQDVTSQKESENALVNSEQKFR